MPSKKTSPPNGQSDATALVIDADVATHATSKPGVTAAENKSCRRFMTVVLSETKHHAAMSPELSKEWIDHASKFSRQWLTTMGQRGRVKKFEKIRNESLRRDIAASAPKQVGAIEKMNKDAHLIELSLLASKIVISNDEKVRKPFREVAAKVVLLRSISWVNPAHPQDTAFDWVKGGCQFESHRVLSHR